MLILHLSAANIYFLKGTWRLYDARSFAIEVACPCKRRRKIQAVATAMQITHHETEPWQAMETWYWPASRSSAQLLTISTRWCGVWEWNEVCGGVCSAQVCACDLWDSDSL